MATDPIEAEDREIIASRVRAKGERAKVELATVNEICTGLRAAMVERIIVTPADNVRMLDRLINGVQTVDAIRKGLNQLVNEGESARMYDNYLDQMLEGRGPRQGR